MVELVFNMTVKELIELLKDVDPKLSVGVCLNNSDKTLNALLNYIYYHQGVNISSDKIMLCGSTSYSF